jgi:hypothetical protein
VIISYLFAVGYISIFTYAFIMDNLYEDVKEPEVKPKKKKYIKVKRNGEWVDEEIKE